MTVAAGGDIFQQRLLFQFQRGQLCFQAHNLFRHGIETHAHAGGGGVEQVDCLVRQLTAGQVAAGKRNGRTHCVIGDVHVMVFGIAGFQASEHQAGGFAVPAYPLNAANRLNDSGNRVGRTGLMEQSRQVGCRITLRAGIAGGLMLTKDAVRFFFMAVPVSGQ